MSPPAMELTPTVALAAFALALTVLFGWLGARPARPHAPPRLVPWRFLMMLAFVGMIAALVHAVALLRGSSGS
jgi:hypothetical protein